MTATETQMEYVRNQIENRLASFKASMNWYRERSFRIQLSSVAISALITILAGLKAIPVSADNMQNIVLVLGALSTVIAAFGALTSPRESWHLTAETYANLRALQATIEFAQRSPEFVEQEAKIAERFFDEFQGVMKEYNAKWQLLRGKSK